MLGRAVGDSRDSPYFWLINQPPDVIPPVGMPAERFTSYFRNGAKVLQDKRRTEGGQRSEGGEQSRRGSASGWFLTFGASALQRADEQSQLSFSVLRIGNRGLHFREQQFPVAFSESMHRDRNGPWRHV